MFSAATKYLIQKRSLRIPQVGSFTIVQQPATLDIAEKLMYPPLYSYDYATDNAGYQQAGYSSGFLPDDDLEVLGQH